MRVGLSELGWGWWLRNVFFLILKSCFLSVVVKV
jgi:hypothetical protein